MKLFQKEISLYLIEGVNTTFSYNRRYIGFEKNKLINKTKQNRYLTSDKIYLKNVHFVKNINIPKGFQIILLGEKGGRYLLNNNSNKVYNGGFTFLLQVAPKSIFEVYNYIEAVSTDKKQNLLYTNYEKQLDNIVHKQKKIEEEITFNIKEDLSSIMMKERYLILKKEVQKKNSIIYIGDTFTKFNLQNYFNVISLEKDDVYILEKLISENILVSNIDFIFIESGWLGEKNTWRKKLISNSTELNLISRIAKENEVKIIFMNKEDPMSFLPFINVAKIADVIFTSDEACISRYKQHTKNPVVLQKYFINNEKYNFYLNSQTKEKKNIFFAGAYYKKYKERTKFFDSFCALSDIDIYDRNINNSTINKMPEEVVSKVVDGGKSQDELIELSQNYKFSLNLSSIVDSKTMIARRFFENIALGKPQVSNYSLALENLAEYEVLFNKQDDVEKIIKDMKNYQVDKAKLQSDSLKIIRELSTYEFINKLNNLINININLKKDFEIIYEANTYKDIIQILNNIIVLSGRTNISVNIKTNLDCEIEIIKYLFKLYYKKGIEININAHKDSNISSVKLVANKYYPKEFLLDIYYISKFEGLEVNTLIIKNNEQEEVVVQLPNKPEGKELFNLPYKFLNSNDILPLITTAYPTYENLYQNGFVYSRVMQYLENNVLAFAVKIVSEEKENIYEFNNTVCFELSFENLIEFYKIIKPPKTEVHFLTQSTANLIQKVKGDFIVFIHGYEAQDLTKRRSFLFENDNNLLEVEKQKINIKRKVYSKVLGNKRVVFNFVSEWQINVFNEDINIKNIPYKYQVLPNKINVEQFNFVEKKFKKLKILSIRPFASTVYANDITVETIEKLSQYEFFDDLEFTICGAGKLYGKVVRNLYEKRYSNVKFVNKILTHTEIKEKHDEHNIFMCPSRTDTQGVSRCEAMSSGLITIGTGVDGVLEFNGINTGFLLEENSSDLFVEKIIELYYDRRDLPIISKAGSDYIKKKCGYDILGKPEVKKHKSKNTFFRVDDKKYAMIDHMQVQEPKEVVVKETGKYEIYTNLEVISFEMEEGLRYLLPGNESEYNLKKGTKIFLDNTIVSMNYLEDFDELKFINNIIRGQDYISYDNKLIQGTISTEKFFNKYDKVDNLYNCNLEYNNFKDLYINDLTVNNYDEILEISKMISIQIPIIIIEDSNKNITNILASLGFLKRYKVGSYATREEILNNIKIMKQAIYKQVK